MCLAIPGQVSKIVEGTATINYGGETREASTILHSCKVGDWVIVSARFVMRVIPETDALATLKLWDQTGKV